LGEKTQSEILKIARLFKTYTEFEVNSGIFSKKIDFDLIQSLEPKKSWYLGLGWVLKKPKIQTQLQTQKPKESQTQTQAQTQNTKFFGFK
jgi:hypothetical protein